jgi:predicted dehydrogenase
MAVSADRRQFLQASTMAGVGYWITGGLHASASTSPNEQIQVGCIGVGGKGDSDTKNAAEFGQIYAMCDVDADVLDSADQKLNYSVAHKFSDFREMLDRMGDRIDAVTISTPDHNHAVIASKAMRMGKHCFCQKPLTRTIWEARQLGDIARVSGVATQMGNQWTAFNPMRKAAYQVRAGLLGTVNEVHIWTNRPIWPVPESRPMIQAVPSNLDWSCWLGPASYRPYGDGYHPFSWRGWWDFGTGALGDMACHTCNLPFMALNMRDPISVEAECPEHDGDAFPAWSRIRFEFPELGGRAPFTMTWYDGGQLPPMELFDDVTHNVKDGDDEVPPPWQSGVLMIGEKAKMYAAGDYAEKGIEIIGDVEPMDVEFPPARGHVEEWFNAIRNFNEPATSNFPSYAGPLTETILLGNLAVWKRGRVEWDPKNLKPLNDPSLDRIVHAEYHNGYSV